MNARALQMLRERRVWMASPSSFIDPFDCQPSILRDDETEQRDLKKIIKNRLAVIKQALRNGQQLAGRQLQPLAHRELVKLRRTHRPDNEKYRILKKHFPTPPDAEVVLDKLKETLNMVGVLSLSATPTEVLMWAHYASQHTRFCIGFERARGSLLADHAHAVIYSKSKDWEYEQEWRVLVSDGGKLASYPGPLRKIIFGLRCGEDSRREIRQAALESAECPILFAEIESATGSFALRVRDLETVEVNNRNTAAPAAQ